MEPIAKRLRQSAESALLPTAKRPKPRRGGEEEEEDVAARIRRLEAELQQSGGSSSSDSDSDSASDDSGGSDHDGEDGGGVLSLSAYADERVEALPAQLLPPAESSASALAHGGKPKRKNKDKAPSATAAQLALLDEIDWPKKVPFACKPCGFVGEDMAAFEAHRRSEAHQARAAVGQGRLQCALCAKAFTSPSQLAEHKAGKWHQQRLLQRKERHVVRVCYDFMRGSCRRGAGCAFEHTETKAMKRGAALDKTRRRACDAFARAGTCRFGDKCLFSHAASE